MSILCSSKIGFSWITLPNRPGRNFTQWWGLRWDASLETLGDLSQRRPKWSRKIEHFLSGRQRLWNAISQRPICVKFGDNMWIDVVINPFGKEVRNFYPKRGHSPPKTDFLRCVSVDILLSAYTDKLKSFWVKMTVLSLQSKGQGCAFVGWLLVHELRFRIKVHRKFGLNTLFSLIYCYMGLLAAASSHTGRHVRVAYSSGS